MQLYFFARLGRFTFKSKKDIIKNMIKACAKEEKEENCMKIAVITGASSGMGREFVKQLAAQQALDEIWVIARREARLKELKEQVAVPLRILALDLALEESFLAYENCLQQQKPDVAILVNCSGYGKFGHFAEISIADMMGMIDLNCKALVRMTALTLPYMKSGAEIYQLDSLSSFQPVPYINIYGATKAFVLSHSRALNMELKPRGIRVMAVCPGWVDTEFFDRAETQEKKVITYFNAIYQPQDVVRTALRDMKRGKDVSIHGWKIKLQVFFTKLLPHRLVMGIWMKQQKFPLK